MGLGDALIATGLARGAKARGKRIAFGDKLKIRWKTYEYEIFRNNPNVAPPGSERDSDIEWVAHYAGDRIYNFYPGGDHWVWRDFKPIPGEIFFDQDELDFGKKFGSGFIVIEPNVPEQKSVANNKRWPFERWQSVADQLRKEGHEIVQFRHSGGRALSGVREIKTPTFRKALAVLQHAKLFMGCEGGMHHGAASVAIPAVVLFGGFIPPSSTGYEFHANIFTGGEACGKIVECEHCKQAMRAITVERVLGEARKLIWAKKN